MRDFITMNHEHVVGGHGIRPNDLELRVHPPPRTRRPRQSGLWPERQCCALVMCSRAAAGTTDDGGEDCERDHLDTAMDTGRGSIMISHALSGSAL